MPLKSLWSRRPLLTRSGLYTLCLTSTTAMVAVITGNNLYWFLFATGVALLGSNAWLAFRSLRSISLRRALPQTAYAQEPFAGYYEVHNSAALPAFYVFFEDLPVPPPRAPGTTRPVVTFAAALPARASVHVPFHARLASRGWNRFRTVRLSTDFPFGFFRVFREIPLQDEILVYPRVGRVLQPLPVERTAEGLQSLDLRRAQPGQDDFAGLHEWRPGDNPKAIHWPSWGRLPGTLLVREYERTRVPRACLILDRQTKSERRFEQVVSLTAANLIDLHEHGIAASLWCGGEGAVTATGPEALLSELAEVDRTESAGEELAAAVSAAADAGELPVVIGDGTKRRHRDAGWARAAVLVDVAAGEVRTRYRTRGGAE
ncbi:MAG: DUF58 domain-containing protein [Planctomycetes bacterium]|nr:DUF58 domain-containing protein [Planctomycetota bacterium]